MRRKHFAPLWSQREVDRLVALFRTGMPLSEIAQAMGRSYNSVYMKLDRLHLVNAKGKRPMIPAQKDPAIKAKSGSSSGKVSKYMVTSGFKVHPERMAEGPFPLPAGHPISWGAISNVPWNGLGQRGRR